MVAFSADSNFEQTNLTYLFEDCQMQIRIYHRGNKTSQSSSCAEIVHRASKGDRAAFDYLLEISAQLVRLKCTKNLRALADDIVQEVSIRLARKFGNQISPYVASTFPAYHAYLNLTLTSVISNWLRDNGPEPLSLEHLYDDQGVEPVVTHDTDTQSELEARDLLQKLLALLPNPLERAVFYHRYVLEESPDEITIALQSIKPDLTKKEVYRLAERAGQRLKRNPTARQLLQR